ncbi:helix-turn-helix transcriptional regulator [Proteiniclasticum sp. SCR006]|uniref:Helix-turn-helix transcriptional regulator n=1 Tax=Proteiniclasticum aestuarii TaxID=2817862 RepID=A0A939KLA6_9CLOT|nr:AraC family transcriptional regulator [Proteiniclasticum aestuarii]MBO1265485.1 helix-turn-helix transcriptional regulator [Proteiniclasticum aestuarii]
MTESSKPGRREDVMYDMEELYDVCTSLGKSMGIEFALIDEKGKAKFRMAIRKDVTLFKYRSQYKEQIIEELEGTKENAVLVFTDNLGAQYLAVATWAESRPYYLIGGPFLSMLITREKQSAIMEENQIPLQDQRFLFEAIQTMKVLNQEECASVAKIMLWILRKKHLTADLIYRKSRQVNYELERPREIEESFTIIDERYRMQNEMMYFVSIGDSETAKKMGGKTVYDFSYRVPGDPMRAIKNQYLTFNTVLRIALERVGVAPLSLHQLSDNMAILIERTSSMDQLLSMGNRLIDEYSSLARKHHSRGLTRNIHNAQRYIENHLAEKIHLDEIAEEIGVSASHLSRQFRKETGKTLTQFIQSRRVEKAKSLLRLNQSSITEVSVKCGFDELNYFSKVFRKHTGCTPMEYQKLHKC